VRTLRPDPSWLAILAGSLTAGCAFPPLDVHLAPLYSRHALAAGGTTHEILGGIVEIRHDEPMTATPSTVTAVHPLFWHRSGVNYSETDLLFPLGRFLFTEDHSTERFFPLWWWKRRESEDGPRNTYFAFFPFAGTLKDWFTYDEIDFVLFPLYGATYRSQGNQNSYAVLFPLTGWGHGDAGWRWWRLWPLYGHSEYPGHYNRHFFLWPFWHSEVNFLNTANPSTEWMLWPFYGQVERGAFHARTVMWPFFGWEWNEETGYSNWDGPWPIVRIERNASGRPYSRERVMPFYAHYRGEEIDSSSYLWPFVWERYETTPAFDRDSFIIAPFFYHFGTQRHREGVSIEEGDWIPGGSDLLWPIFRRYEETGGHEQLDVPWPIPWPRVSQFRENWWPYFSLFGRETDGHGATSTRLVLDLFRHESNEYETRWSVPLLGGHRSLSDGSGEWSLLMGLLRWSSGSDGVKLLLPAFPGPGFTGSGFKPNSP
jgi:hypothetical protein